MNEVNPILLLNPLFRGFAPATLPGLLHCLSAHEENYQKGEVIARTGEAVREIGVVLEGYVDTEYLDYEGKRNILSSIHSQDLFGDAFGFTTSGIYPIDIVSQCDSRILFLSIDKLLHPCSLTLSEQEHLMENLLAIVANKYDALAEKSLLLSRRSTRDKLLAFFYQKAKEAKGLPFTIPFTQQELADYLFVERSGLSLELNKLKKEGILNLSHGYYRLKKPFREI